MEETKFKNWNQWVHGWSRNKGIRNSEEIYDTYKPSYPVLYFYDYFQPPYWYDTHNIKKVDRHYQDVWDELLFPLLDEKYEIIRQKSYQRLVKIETIDAGSYGLNTKMLFYVNSKGRNHVELRKEIFNYLKREPVVDVVMNLWPYEKYLRCTNGRDMFCKYSYILKETIRKSFNKETIEEIGIDNFCGVCIVYSFHVSARNAKEHREYTFIYGEDSMY